MYLLQCNGNYDTYWRNNERIELNRCVHYEAIAKRKKADHLKHYTLVTVYAIVTAGVLYIVL